MQILDAIFGQSPLLSTTVLNDTICPWSNHDTVSLFEVQNVKKLMQNIMSVKNF